MSSNKTVVVGNGMSGLGMNPPIEQSEETKAILNDIEVFQAQVPDHELGKTLTGAGVDIPPQPETTIDENEIGLWWSMAQKLKKLRAQEIMARKRIFGFFFKDPDEGTNNHNLDGGYVLKGGYKLDRKIDEGAFVSMKEKFREAGINPDVMVKQELTLVKKEYNKLSDKQVKLFDQVLLIKPGSPSLDVVMPAKNKPKVAK